MSLYDELAELNPPANAAERMLLTQVVESWDRLQRAHELENQYFKDRDMVEVLRTKLEEFKAITRYVTDCERAWRHALVNLEKAQRRRQRETVRPVDVPRPSEPARPHTVSAVASLPKQPVAEIAYPMRA